MKKIWNKSLLTLYFITMISMPVLALEPLTFGGHLGTTLRIKLDDFLKSNFDTSTDSYDYALQDLNSDGIDEIIIKRKTCSTSKNSCFFLILAEKSNEILLLSKIEAKNIMIGGTSSHGIKDILAFSAKMNDYNFDIYVWSPKDKTYILQSE